MRHIIAVSLTNWSGYLQASSAALLTPHPGPPTHDSRDPVNFLIRRLIKKSFRRNTEFFSIIQALKSKTGNTNLTYALN